MTQGSQLGDDGTVNVGESSARIVEARMYLLQPCVVVKPLSLINCAQSGDEGLVSPLKT